MFDALVAHLAKNAGSDVRAELTSEVDELDRIIDRLQTKVAALTLRTSQLEQLVSDLQKTVAS
jgi:prefoldin subunit 5